MGHGVTLQWLRSGRRPLVPARARAHHWCARATRSSQSRHVTSRTTGAPPRSALLGKNPVVFDPSHPPHADSEMNQCTRTRRSRRPARAWTRQRRRFGCIGQQVESSRSDFTFSYGTAGRSRADTLATIGARPPGGPDAPGTTQTPTSARITGLFSEPPLLGSPAHCVTLPASGRAAPKQYGPLLGPDD